MIEEPLTYTSLELLTALATLNEPRGATITFRRPRDQPGWIIAIGTPKGAHQGYQPTLSQGVVWAYRILEGEDAAIVPENQRYISGD